MELAELTALVRAVARLHPHGDVDPDLVRTLGRLVSPERRVERAVKRRQKEIPGAPADRAALDTRSSAQRKPVGDIPPSPRPATGGPKLEDSGRKNRGADGKLVAIESVLQLISEHGDLVPQQQSTVASEHRERRAQTDAPAAPQPVEALFPAGRVRAILREMATVPTPSGRPDQDAAVKLISGGRPISEMPQFLVSALPHKILWLFDAGPAMLPFARDTQQLARTATRLLGEHRIRIGDFIADPLKGVRPRGQVRWQPLRWPGRWSAIVVVSDLGVGGNQMMNAGPQSSWWSFLEEAGR